MFEMQVLFSRTSWYTHKAQSNRRRTYVAVKTTMGKHRMNRRGLGLWGRLTADPRCPAYYSSYAVAFASKSETMGVDGT